MGRGLESLLDAMPQVAGRLVICGEGDLSAALRAQAARLGLLASGQVEFRGFVLPEALREVTRHAAVGIMLLENMGLSYYYSLANKFFDYVHAGIPQVLIDFPEYRALNDAVRRGRAGGRPGTRHPGRRPQPPAARRARPLPAPGRKLPPRRAPAQLAARGAGAAAAVCRAVAPCGARTSFVSHEPEATSRPEPAGACAALFA